MNNTKEDRRCSIKPPNKYIIDKFGEIKGIYDPLLQKSTEQRITEFIVPVKIKDNE